MESNVEHLRRQAVAIQQQISAWHKTMSLPNGRAGLELSGLTEEHVLAPLYVELERIYADVLPLARLKDTSDIIVHAEGPGAAHSAPQLRAVNWLSNSIKKQLTKMTQVALPMSDKLADVVARKAQWALTGLVPGSIYMGFALERPPSIEGFEDADADAYDTIVSAARSVPVVPQFVREHDVNPELAEALTDPAIRDAAMMAAMQLSPTTASGLDSVELSAPGGAHGTLYHRERVVLRDAILQPLMRKKQVGTFVGELREIDLDSNRFQLRNVDHVGTLRCAMAFNPEQARNWLGQWVSITGEYEADLAGRPRLMRGTELKEYAVQTRLT